MGKLDNWAYSDIIGGMSTIELALGRFPSLQRLYKRAYTLYDDYVIHFSHRWRYYRARIQRKSSVAILSYPCYPRAFHSLYRIAGANGYALTTDLQQKTALAVYFEDTTCISDPTRLKQLPPNARMINERCLDIRKSTVDKIHQQIFGYSVSVDPTRYNKPYVKKTEENSMHTYSILEKPEIPQQGYVYQQVINNEEGNDVRDIRVPVFGTIAAFCFLKYRPIPQRFGNSTRSAIVTTKSVLSDEECRNIERYCQAIGLEFGELDVLRDRDSGKIYIVDVNKTPDSPLESLTKADFQRALELMAAAFHQAFIANASYNRS